MILRSRIEFLVFCLAWATSVALYAQSEAQAQSIETLKSAYERPQTIPFPDHSRYSPQIATLGKMLFFDPRLSSSGNMSCSSCHQPSFGWETAAKVAIGVRNIPLDRAAPPTLNLAWSRQLFWDGRAQTLEQQAAGPITNHLEMNASLELVVERLGGVNYYQSWFNRLFSGGLSAQNILSAIAMYERTIVSGLSDFDLWIRGDDEAISASAKRGFVLFNTKAKCASCHSGWNFTDNQFHDIGLNTSDFGRFKIDASRETNRYAFKTPTLRDIASRAPYMHDGSLNDLEEVMDHYAGGGIDRPSRSAEVAPLSQTDEERADIIAFLKTLTSNTIKVELPILPN